MLLYRRVTTDRDQERLLAAVDRVRDCPPRHTPHLDSFRRDLSRARAVPPAEVPADMITMNSRFVVRSPWSDAPAYYTLVYPEAESLRQGKVSALSPMGMALLGARAGDEVCWMSSDGPEVCTVERVLYQPEAAGHHHL